MFDLKKRQVLVMLGVAVAASFVLIPRSWAQSQVPSAGATTSVEIFAIELEPVEGVTHPRPMQAPARNRKYAFGGFPFFKDVKMYAHQKPLLVVTKADVESCKLKSRVHSPVDGSRRCVLEVGLTKKAQAKLTRRIQALSSGKKTIWSVCCDGDKWWGQQSFPAGGVISSFNACATLDRSEAERIKQSLLKPAKPLTHFRFNDRVQDIANAGSHVVTRDILVKDGALVGDGKVHTAGEARFRVKTPSLNYRSFAVAIRFRLSDLTTKEQPILTCGPATGWLRACVKNDHLFVHLKGGDRRYASGEMDAGRVEAGRWYDLVCFTRRDEGESRVFLNGKAVQRHFSPPAGAFAPEPMDAGSNQNFRIIPKSIAVESLNKPLLNVSEAEKEWSLRDPRTGRTFHGEIDEFIVFARSLSVREAMGLRLGAAK